VGPGCKGLEKWKDILHRKYLGDLILGNQKEIIFGIRAVTEAIQSGQELEKIFFRTDLRGELSSELLNLTRKAGIPSQFVPIEKLNRYTRKNHQGVVALISPILYHDMEKLIPMVYESGRVPLLMVLDGITDVRGVLGSYRLRPARKDDSGRLEGLQRFGRQHTKHRHG